MQQAAAALTASCAAAPLTRWQHPAAAPAGARQRHPRAARAEAAAAVGAASHDAAARAPASVRVRAGADVAQRSRLTPSLWRGAGRKWRLQVRQCMSASAGGRAVKRFLHCSLTASGA